MGFKTGYIYTIENNLTNIDKENINYTWDTENYDHSIWFNFERTPTDLRGSKTICGKVAQTGTIPEETVKIKDNKITVQHVDNQKKYWSNFWITIDNTNKPNFLILENKKCTKAKDYLEEIFDVNITTVNFDIHKLHEDFSVWSGQFDKENSHVSNGTFYGDDIDKDTDFSEAYMDSDKNMAGIELDYMQRCIKIRISKDGFVQLLTNQQRQLYINLVKDTLSDYIK